MSDATEDLQGTADHPSGEPEQAEDSTDEETAEETEEAQADEAE
jgi:hypothetical protein